MPAAPSGANSPRARWWSRRRIALVGSASVLAIAAVAVGIVVATGGRDDVPAFALTEPAPQTAVEAATATCYDDYTWAVGEMGDNGDSGILTVANAWGNQDGRLQQARQFLSDFTAERSRTDDQSAIQAMIQQVYDYCAELQRTGPPDLLRPLAPTSAECGAVHAPRRSTAWRTPHPTGARGAPSY